MNEKIFFVSDLYTKTKICCTKAARYVRRLLLVSGCPLKIWKKKKMKKILAACHDEAKLLPKYQQYFDGLVQQPALTLGYESSQPTWLLLSGFQGRELGLL